MLSCQFGFQFGAAAIDLVFLLMTENAVRAFAKGNVTLGGELGCALGPHGRVAEADLAIRSTAPVLTYSFAKCVAVHQPSVTRKYLETTGKFVYRAFYCE